MILRGVQFEIGELIEQEVDYDDNVGTIAVGKVVSWDSKNGILRYVLDETTGNDKGYSILFKGEENIVGTTSDFVVKPDTNYYDTLEGTNFRVGYATPEIQKYKGYLTYLTNVSPIKREPTQTERISLVISF